MVDFSAHFTIHTITLIGFQILHLTLKVLSLKVVHLSIACQIEHSLRYFHLHRISNSLAIHCSSSHTLLTEKIFEVA